MGPNTAWRLFNRAGLYGEES